MSFVTNKMGYLCLVAAAFSALTAAAQPPNSTTTIWNNPGSSNWTTTSNWSGGAVPDVNIEDAAVINNGGTAFVSSNVAEQAGGVVLGAAVGDTGSLEIRSGGSLTAVASGSFPADGSVRVGQGVLAAGGTGHLTVLPGGSLNSASLALAGAAGSTLTLGGTAAGATNVNAGVVTLFRQTTVTGPNVNFNSSQITITNTATLVPVITAATHSPLKSTGTATIAGILRPQFSGVTPTPGQRWNIVDAGSISGTLTLDSSAAPALGTDQTYIVATVPGGNGARLQLGVEQLLRAKVDWNSKSISITNSGTTAVTIDSYSILSQLGSLNPSQGVWSSLADQTVSGWQEAGATVNALSELNPNGSLTINGGQTRVLGTPFTPVIPAEFGVSPEDIVFEYAKPNGEKYTGVVEYLGNRDTNNFRLTIDPTNGQAQLRNDSNLAIALEGYSILSPTGSLLTSWNSLDDQNIGGATTWQESAPTSTEISELNPLASTNIAPNSGYALGTLWNTGGSRNLQFLYQLADEATSRVGSVVFGALPPLSSGGVPGDYNGDGKVDAADYTVWRNNLGDANEDDIHNNGDGGGVSPTDYQFWKTHFGSSGSASSVGGHPSAQVPEPATLMCVLIASIGLIAGRNRRSLERKRF